MSEADELKALMDRFCAWSKRTPPWKRAFIIALVVYTPTMLYVIGVTISACLEGLC